MIHNVLDYGTKSADDTAIIQKAIDAAGPGDTVLVPKGVFYVNGLKGLDGFMCGGVFLKSDMTLQIDGTLQAITNTSDHYTILTVHGCHKVTVTGGAIVGDRATRPQDLGKGQWGFGIAIWGSRNIKVQNLNISKLWGDGISTRDADQLLVDHVVIDGCMRQNMSVGPGDGITITNCTFKNARFSGLDLELDLESDVLKNVVVKYCSFTDSGGPAHMGVGSPVGTYQKISISECQFDLKMQPLFVHDRAGDLGTPWWAFLLNRICYQGLHLPTYRFVGYPQSWTSKT